MSFNINTFQSHLNRTGFHKANLFDVDITGPGVPGGDLIRMRAFSAEIPGRTLSTTEYRIYGPIRKIPYASTYTDTRIEFLCSKGLEEKMIFENWHDRITNTMADMPAAHQTHGVSGQKYNIGYYDDFAKGTITINLHSETGDKELNKHVFHEVYPIGIAPIGVSWDSADLVKLAVTFAFRDYTVEKGRVTSSPVGIADFIGDGED